MEPRWRGRLDALDTLLCSQFNRSSQFRFDAVNCDTEMEVYYGKKLFKGRSLADKRK